MSASDAMRLWEDRSSAGFWVVAPGQPEHRREWVERYDVALEQSRVDSLRWGGGYVLGSMKSSVFKGRFWRVVAIFRNGVLQTFTDPKQEWLPLVLPDIAGTQEERNPRTRRNAA